MEHGLSSARSVQPLSIALSTSPAHKGPWNGNAMTGFKPNPRALPAFSDALNEYARLTKKDNPEGIEQLMRQSAKRFIKNVVDITPPARGKADSAAKKAGEQSILGDLLKLAQPIQGLTRRQAKDVLASADDLMKLQTQSRDSAGRIKYNGPKLEVLHSDLVRTAALLGKRVGWLAAGLNAAAGKLGFKLPAWVARHGNAFGIIEINFSETRFHIKIGQNVPYADNVKGYARKFDFAFQREVKSLQGMIRAVAEKAARKARARIK